MDRRTNGQMDGKDSQYYYIGLHSFAEACQKIKSYTMLLTSNTYMYKWLKVLNDYLHVNALYQVNQTINFQ